MLNQQESELLARSHRFHNSLWTLLMVSLVVYLVVCHVVETQFLQSAPSDTLIRDMIFLMALGAVILALVVRRLLLKVKPSRPLTLLAPMVCAKAVERYRIALFISLAFAEAIAMYGLILFFIGYGLTNLYVFIALSALSLYLLRPRYGEMETFSWLKENYCHEPEMPQGCFGVARWIFVPNGRRAELSLRAGIEPVEDWQPFDNF